VHYRRGKALSAVLHILGVYIALAIKWNKHAPYYIVICDFSALIIFPHYVINGTIFGRKFLNIKFVFWFCLRMSLCLYSLCLKHVSLSR